MAVDGDGAGVCLAQAGDDLHQLRLTVALDAGYAEDLALAKGEAHVVYDVPGLERMLEH